MPLSPETQFFVLTGTAIVIWVLSAIIRSGSRKPSRRDEEREEDLG
jgi:hypothetical protein